MLANVKPVVLSAEQKEEIYMEEIKSICTILEELDPYNQLPREIKRMVNSYQESTAKEIEELRNQGSE